MIHIKQMMIVTQTKITIKTDQLTRRQNIKDLVIYLYVTITTQTRLSFYFYTNEYLYSMFIFQLHFDR
jgi:hypothetical protein